GLSTYNAKKLLIIENRHMVQLQYESLNLEYLLGFAAVLIAQKP
ncbi:8702_t:CDS:1, partial [Gigaspora rosea]